MSGTVNPLAASGAPAPAQTTAPTPSAPNPLQAGGPSPGAGQQQRATFEGQAMLLAQATLGMPPEQRQKMIDYFTYTTNELARLASNKNVSRKDVVRATADAIGARIISADQGIQLLGQVPENPDQLRPWLNEMYHEFLVTSVAMHAVDTIHKQVKSQPQVVPVARPGLAVVPPTEPPPGVEARSPGPPSGMPAAPPQGQEAPT